MEIQNIGIIGLNLPGGNKFSKGPDESVKFGRNTLLFFLSVGPKGLGDKTDDRK